MPIGRHSVYLDSKATVLSVFASKVIQVLRGAEGVLGSSHKVVWSQVSEVTGLGI